MTDMAMTIEVRYYKIHDLVSKTETKDLGWTVTTDFMNVHKIWDKESNTWDIIEEKPSKSVYVLNPPEADAVEITKEQYDALDTSGESERIKVRRTKKTAQLESLKQKAVVR